jgi:hypothetical protein
MNSKEGDKMQLTYLDKLGHRLDVVRATRQQARSKWAYDYWKLVEARLMKKLSELSRKYTL